MAYCVFMHRPDSIYDDKPDERYQFPKQYYGRANHAIGGWIVYLEPTKVTGSRGYFASAKLQQVIEDPSTKGMYLAIMEPGTYLAFPNKVPFSDIDGPIERGLLNDTGKLSGRAQSAVRPVSPIDFDRIVERGIAESDAVLPRDRDLEVLGGFQEEQVPFAF